MIGGDLVPFDIFPKHVSAFSYCKIKGDLIMWPTKSRQRNNGEEEQVLGDTELLSISELKNNVCREKETNLIKRLKK